MPPNEPTCPAPFAVLLIRHAEPTAQSVHGAEENERGLSAKGQVDATALADSLADVGLTAIYSSPYPRALQTVEPLAKRYGLKIETVDDLRERSLSPSPLPDWGEHLRRAWRDFDYAPAGGESSRDAQARILHVLERTAQRHKSGLVAFASHGNLIALALNAITASVGFDFWATMPLPAVFRLQRLQESWKVVSGPGF